MKSAGLMPAFLLVYLEKMPGWLVGAFGWQ